VSVSRGEVQWAASEQRIGIIEAENLERTFEKLGGAPFLADLRRAHKAYGQALGVTEAKGAPSPAHQIREARDVVLDDIRVYAAQIVASVTRRNPASEQVAQTLLRLLSTWPTRRSAAAAPEESPAPAVSPSAE